MIEIEVENIKCGGCANSIANGLKKDERITAVDVDIDKGIVKIEADDSLRDDAVAKLLSMGYPEKGSVEGLKSAKAKATSFVSCAIGRMNE